MKIILLAAFLIGSSAFAQPAANPGAEDRAAIQALMGQYSQALTGCKAAEFADLFVPQTGYFASGFRGVMAGREKLIALIESERQCAVPGAKLLAPRPGGANGPTVALDVTGGVVHGLAKAGNTEYQDEYVKTEQGWRFASRTVITAAEKGAGLDARGVLAIQRLAGANIGDHYEPDQNGHPSLMTSGVKVSISGDQVTGRAYLKDGGYDDQTYEKLGSGEWRLKSSVHVPAATQ
jgi:SnoaL-like domain